MNGTTTTIIKVNNKELWRKAALHLLIPHGGEWTCLTLTPSDTRFLGPTWVSQQMASWSFHSFFCRITFVTDRRTVKQTDRHVISVATGHIYAMHAMPNNNCHTTVHGLSCHMGSSTHEHMNDIFWRAIKHAQIQQSNSPLICFSKIVNAHCYHVHEVNLWHGM